MDLYLCPLLSSEDEWSPWNVSLYLSALTMFLSRQGQALQREQLKVKTWRNNSIRINYSLSGAFFQLNGLLPFDLSQKGNLKQKTNRKKEREKTKNFFFGNCASTIINFSIPVFFPRPFFSGTTFFLCVAVLSKNFGQIISIQFNAGPFFRWKKNFLSESLIHYFLFFESSLFLNSCFVFETHFGSKIFSF